jgi:hypothetical protein
LLKIPRTWAGVKLGFGGASPPRSPFIALPFASAYSAGADGFRLGRNTRGEGGLSPATMITKIKIVIMIMIIIFIAFYFYCNQWYFHAKTSIAFFSFSLLLGI